MNKENPAVDETAPQADAQPNPRSENLLPADRDSTSEDGRFDIAEEVSLDQQSDSSRKIGQLADDASAQALAESIEEKSQNGI
ncbi:MAG: hypothetical protein M3Y65_22770 [Pseudomonadota bacterium]|nr:hypothetical protein [Pseudomonadota bacterium]